MTCIALLLIPEHFESLLNSSVDTSNKCHVSNTLRSTDMTFVRFSNVAVLSAIKSLKNGKSTGLDNLHSEHFKYAHGKVAVLLAIVLNAIIIHDFLPSTTTSHWQYHVLHLRF